MALVNPNIALSVKPIELADPMAQYSKMVAIQGAQQQNALAQQQMAEYERARAEEESLRNYLTQSDLTKPETRAGLARFGKTGLAYGKALTEQDTAALTQQETALKIQKAKKDFVAQAQRDTSQNPSDANITAYKEDLIANPLFTAAEKQQMIAGADRLLSMPVDQRRSIMSSQGASAGELKPQVSVGPTGIAQIPAFGGAATIVPGTAEAFQMTPAQIAQNKIAQQQLAVSQGQLSVAQQRLANEGQGVTYQQDAQGNLIALPSRLPAGGAPVARPVTGEGGAPIQGKPSAFAEKAAALQKQQAKDISLAITEIENAIKPGGLLEKSTASGAGKLADMGAAFFGSATPGAIAAASLKPIADLGLKMIPRFEGPQSDKDTASYKEAAGQLANEALPVATRKSAAETMLRIMKARKGQFANEAMATEGITPRIAPPAGFTPD